MVATDWLIIEVHKLILYRYYNVIKVYVREGVVEENYTRLIKVYGGCF